MKLKVETNIDLNSYYDSFPPKLRLEIQAAVAKLITGSNPNLRTGQTKTDNTPEGAWVLTKKVPTRITSKTYRLLAALNREGADPVSGEDIKKHLYAINGGKPQGATTRNWIDNMVRAGYMKVAK